MAINPLKSSAVARQAAAICEAPPEVVEQARQIIHDVQYRVLPSSASVVASIGFSLPYKIPTTSIPTMAVTIGADGTYVFMYNPFFTVQLAETEHGPKVVVWHEIGGHILQLDCLMDKSTVEDPGLYTMAEESRINYIATRLVFKCPMPTIDGKVTGVDPEDIRKELNADRRKKGLDPVSFEDLFRTVDITYRYLLSMDKPPSKKRGRTGSCSHGEGAGEPGEGESEPGQPGQQPGSGKLPLDREAADKIAKALLAETINAAINNGDQRAKQEILTLMDASEGNEAMSKMWGDLAASRLRGVKVASRKTDVWKNWTMNSIGTRLQDGERWIYAEKLGAVTMALGLPTPIRPRGKRELKKGSVYLDVSGSMSRSVLDQIAPLINDTPELETSFFDFDSAVAPIGEYIRDGGGTSFQCIDDHVNAQDDDPDFVLVITDGYAPHIVPKDPTRWIWLIVPGGDDWPSSMGMASRPLEPEDLR